MFVCVCVNEREEKRIILYKRSFFFFIFFLILNFLDKFTFHQNLNYRPIGFCITICNFILSKLYSIYTNVFSVTELNVIHTNTLRRNCTEVAAAIAVIVYITRDRD